jgi:hypothetical protein
VFDSSGDFGPFLQSGERIVWTGRPSQGLRFSARDVLLVPFSLLWGGSAIFWETTALAINARIGAGGSEAAIFPLFGIPFVLVGLYMIVGRFLLDAWVRSRMTYALTDRRALILRRLLGERLITVTLANAAQLRLTRHGARGDIEFEPARFPFFGNSWGLWTPSLDGAARFIGIDDAAEVFRLAQRAAGRDV